MEIEVGQADLEAADLAFNVWDNTNELALAFARHRQAAIKERDAQIVAWLPIETAPKDGTLVLLWQKGHPQFVGEYVIDRWWTEAEWANDCERLRPPECDPTHWQPLPPPPE